MTHTKQTVYLPVKVEDVKKYSNHIIDCEDCLGLTDDEQYTCPRCWCQGGNGKLHFVDIFEQKEGYFFTPEQLNQLLSDVIKDALDTAADSAYVDNNHQQGCAMDSDDFEVNKESITDTFDITYQKHKVL